MFDVPELKLKGQMSRTYLIQRLTRPTGPNSFAFGGGGLKNGGLSKEALQLLANVCSFDYMGDFEFENGSVPAAFHFIWQQGQRGHLVSGTHRDVFYICPKAYEDGVRGVISQLLDDEPAMRLLEPTGLAEKWESICGWLEVNNGFMFFTDATMFERTKTLFEAN